MFDWIKTNKLLAAGAALLIAILFFPRFVKKIFGGTTHRRRVRKAITGSYTRRRRSRRAPVRAARRAARRTKRRAGKAAKKPWQIKGSRAARLHMARLRRLR